MKPKYDNFKQEIINYKYINIKQYKQEIFPKAGIYHKTQMAKAMKSDDDINSCEISQDEVISTERIMSIILYTDYSDLSCHFTSSFRQSTHFEPIQATIQRHRIYYWWSRLLKETVIVYGSNSENGLYGPFYCGMSTVMTLSQFNIKLFSPTSTSCHLEVAMKFSGEDGVIIQFDNSKGWATQVNGLDVSWISRYKAEDERYGLLHRYKSRTMHWIRSYLYWNYLEYSDCFLVTGFHWTSHQLGLLKIVSICRILLELSML